MTETEFIELNDRLHKRQAPIRKAREQSEPVHIATILPQVMENIRQRMKRQRIKEL